MSRWIERQGLTFRLADGTSEHLVRLSLIERKGLWSGWFNVREARANGQGQLHTATGGRRLSWRWLRRPQADQLLEERTRTLGALGYVLLDSGLAARGPWDWLHELVRRGLQGDAAPPAHASAALHDALVDLGLGLEDITEGVADVLGIHPTRMAHPDPDTIATVDLRVLAIVLPFLLEHATPEVRQIGIRWLQSPTTLYELPPNILMNWLQRPGPAGDHVLARLPAEGLALLGPERLLGLARGRAPEPVREVARTWARRLG